MKRRILTWLGFSPDYPQQIADLQTTVASLREELQDLHDQAGDVLAMVNLAGYKRGDKKWWDDPELHTINPQAWLLAQRIKDTIKLNYCKKFPSLQERMVFHGHCLGCVSPTTISIGRCTGCSYANPASRADLKITEHEDATSSQP